MESSWLAVKCRGELESPICSAPIRVTTSQGTGLFLWNHPTAPACPYSHYSYSKFSSSDLLKTNITEFQQAKLGMCSSYSNPCIPKLFPLAFTGSCPWRGQSIAATRTYIHFSGISFESALRISLPCKMSETIWVPLSSACVLPISTFSLEKNKSIWCPGLFSHMVHTRLELNQN